ncbi:MAG: SusD/RagB family nutrient-binding outer membrane lipoprotein, partial [Bacteroidales bacterium]
MKNIRFKFIGVLLLMVLVLGSCKKWIDTSMNANPDAPKDVPMSSLLPAIEANMAYTLIGGNDYSRVTSEWMQYYQGVARQSQGESNYIWHDGDVDNVWNTSYSGSMENLNILKSKAMSAKDNMNNGMADVLMAETLGFVTDIWGDVPFSQAFQGLSQLSPAFDKQQDLYAKILNLLDDAITSFQATPLVYEIGDLIYPNADGDPAAQATAWLKAAYGMKARYTLHLSKTDATSWATALTLVKSALASNNDDMQFAFGASVGQQNPLFQFMDQRGDIAMHKVFIDMLTQRFDPRIAVFAAPAYTDSLGNHYRGADWGSTPDTVSLPGSAVASPTSSVQFLDYTECLFIKAECEYKTSDIPDAKTDLISGVSASLNKWGVFSAAYITAYTAVVDTMTGSLYKEIMAQKYIALYNQAETFNDWRRTDNLIGLSPNPTTSAVENVIPR